MTRRLATTLPLHALALALALGPAGACRRRPAPVQPPADEEPEAEPEAPAGLADAGPPQASAEPAELEPGSVRAFGLALPLGTTERLVTDRAKIYYVPAPMPKVMRYLQRRLEITTAEIHPLGAMIRGARVRVGQSEGAEPHRVDVGVRDEGDRTLVQLWDAEAAPPAVPRSSAESLRAAGIDPATGRPLPGNNN